MVNGNTPSTGILRRVYRGALIGAVAILTACSHESANKEPLVTVQVTPAKTAAIQQTVNAEAVLYPTDQAAITPKISAPVTKFLVQRGSRVHRGQLLAILENKDLEASAIENRGTYQQAQAGYETSVKAGLPEEWQKAALDAQAAQDALNAAQKVYESRQNLYRQGALPRKDLDAAQVAYVEARNQYQLAEQHLKALQAGGKQQQLKSAQGQLESARGKYLGAEAQLNYSEIRSPIDGIVTERPLYPGEMAAAGTPLITVMNTSKVVARAHIPQDQAALLKVGDPATISSPETEKPVEGEVTVVSPALDPNSTTVEVWVQASNPQQRLRPGASVRLSMVAHKISDAVVVPASALLTSTEGEISVMVVGSDGRAHQQAVKVGVREDAEVQIVSGVKPGDKVISKGAFGLPDNTQVQVESASQPEEQKKAKGD